MAETRAMCRDAPRHVVAALVERGGRVLVARRQPGDRRGGCWEFPGGTVEMGETLARAVVRELAEELALEVDVDGEVLTLAHSYPDCRIVLHLLACRPRGQPRPQGCAELRWVRWQDLPDLELAGADRRAAVRLLRAAGRGR
ncbi:MAG: (deoxy)nucleoside triphosphate pyrophosphohydrolase [Candidatus Bipolaricaulaceae bacterium]